MITWVLQAGSRFGGTGTNQKIIQHLEKTGHRGIEITIVPFSREVVGGIPLIEGPVVAYGSTAIQTVVKQAGWTPGVWLSPDVREDRVRDALGPLYLNHEMIVVPVREAARVASERGWEPFFCKPATDDKHFAGTVFSGERYPFFAEAMLAEEWIPDEFEVCVSPVRNLGIEWRLPVVDSKVADYSIYRQWRTVMPSREIYPEVLEFAERVIARHDPAPAYTIDVAQVDDELKVIEFNGFNSAGFYECDVGNIVDAVNQMVERKHTETVECSG